MVQNSRLAVGVAAGLVVGFLALFVMVGMTVWLGERANTFFIQITTERDIRAAAVELRDSLRTAESSQRGYILTGNEIYLAPYNSAKTRALQQLSDLTRLLTADTRPAPLLRRLRDVVGDKIGEMDQSIKLKAAGQDGDALAVIRTNRGKALMDVINVFLYGAILDADEISTIAGAEQQRNTLMLRWVSLIASAVIILVVVAVAMTVYRNRQEIARARDEVYALNSSLEERVQSRTADLAQARERAELLLSEVNHRVANSLQLVAALVNMQSRSVKDEAAKDALNETQSRIHAIAQIHKSLYASGDATSVELSEYLGVMLENLGTAMRKDGYTATLRCDLEPVRLRTDDSVSLGVVVTELVTNAFKYAYPPGQSGEICVTLKRLSEDQAELIVQDDGVGLNAKPQHSGTGLGSKIIKSMAATLKTQVDYLNRASGTAARLAFSATRYD